MWPGLLARIAQEIAGRQVHPARVLVLLPYGQLQPLANRLWARCQPQGFAPRFETTQSWARAWGADAAAAQAGDDYRFDAALDSLTARHLLERAGLGQEQESLLPRLLLACSELAGRAAAVPPAQRAAWSAQALAALPGGFDCEALRLDGALTHLALAWAASSSYPTDVLWDQDGGCAARHSLDCLIVLEGLQADALTQALAACFGDKALSLPLAVAAAPGQARVYPAQDFEEEALLAAACVLRRVEAREQARDAVREEGLAGRAGGSPDIGPVALVAIDRTLTRRIGAMLATQGISVRDDTGWTLSTTRAAATLMASLQACGWQASSDAVLDWLKNAPAFPEPLVGRLENLLRQARCGLWRDRVVPAPEEAREDKPQDAAATARKDALKAMQQASLQAFDQQLQQLLDAMRSPRPLRQWLADLVLHLQASGLWQPLLDDAAGEAVVKALHLGEAAQAALTAWPLAGRRLRLDEFSSWVRHALESSSFKPPPQAAEQVVILPLAQLLARPFSAVVLPGCDEVRLSPSPEMPGSWTGPERQALGLATREAGEAALRSAWQQALQQAEVDMLWRRTDSGGEALLPSPLLQLWLLAQPAAEPAADAAHGLCASRLLTPAPTARPNPQGQALPVRRLSASAYEDLRRCPYRFFALRQLGLKELGELDNEFEKRDFGDWLHEVLKIFHQGLADPHTELEMAALGDPAARLALLDLCAEQTLQRRRFSVGEFLPFRAAWPDLRDGYLRWLAGHEQGGGRFEAAETWHEMPLGSITLVGRIDRIDSTPATAGAPPGDASARPAYVLDYKTESPGTTQQRLKDPLEDTQLAFYAALLPDDSLRAAYVNLNERDGTKAYEQDEVVDARDALIEGILSDMKRIEGGAVLAALGEGVACDYCAARGLCRKDFWEQAV